MMITISDDPGSPCSDRAKPATSPGESLTRLLERPSRETGGRVLVFDAGRLVGIVTPTDIARAAELGSLRAGSRTAPLAG